MLRTCETDTINRCATSSEKDATSEFVVLVLQVGKEGMKGQSLFSVPIYWCQHDKKKGSEHAQFTSSSSRF